MTEKRFTFDIDNENGFDEPYFCNGTDSFYVNNADEMELFVKEVNELWEENQSIKKHIGELYKYVKIDVDNGIEVYPKVMLEYILNILKIIGDLEWE